VIIKLAKIIGLTFALIMVYEVPAVADTDVHGVYAWNYGGTANFPKECLHAGANIIKSLSPFKHNVAGSNTCGTNYVISASLWEDDASGTIIASCNYNLSVKNTNHDQCPLQHATSGSDYWNWSVHIFDSSGGPQIASMVCSNDGNPPVFNQCFDGT
jgi:hypothetical protein